MEQSENIVTIKYLSSYYAPKEGQHILTVTGLEDYAGYKGLDQDIDFNIIKDTEAPKIIDGAATLDQVIIQFDKEIDPDSISKKTIFIGKLVIPKDMLVKQNYLTISLY